MARTVALDLLNSIKIASPCTADWESMTGDDRARFCGECRLNVYNLSSMSAEDAAALIREKEGHLCVRMFRRADGTVITRDCPVGVRLIRIKAAKAAGRLAAAAMFLISGAMAAATGNRDQRLPKLGSLQPFSTIRSWLTSNPSQQMQGLVVGRLCAPPAAPNAPISSHNPQ
jgi:hypothetical protein